LLRRHAWSGTWLLDHATIVSTIPYQGQNPSTERLYEGALVGGHVVERDLIKTDRHVVPDPSSMLLKVA
jgi:hypothetical protein